MKRSFLFLQGVSSPFFSMLGAELLADGHSVTKLNFTVGDMLYWRIGNIHNFRSRVEQLDEFLDILFFEIGNCTDVILFGDCRPIHRIALNRCRELSIRIHVFEEGYFRPYWVTLERDGVNGASKLPRDPDWFRAVGKSLPNYANGLSFAAPFFARAFHDVAYHAFGMWNPVLYPGYRTHAPYNALTEYLGYIRRAARLRITARRDEGTVNVLAAGKTPYYFVPLQLDSDAQIRDYSSFDNMVDALRLIVESFASFAPNRTLLVIKNHPLDPGMTNYSKVLTKFEKEFDVSGRLVYLESGHLPTLLAGCHGTITVNSTVGASSLVHNRATMALANPIYNMPGLTFQGTLDEFWHSGAAPDLSLFKDFRNTVIHSTQINGGFYSKEGIKMAVNNSLASLTAEKSPLEMLIEF